MRSPFQGEPPPVLPRETIFYVLPPHQNSSTRRRPVRFRPIRARLPCSSLPGVQVAENLGERLPGLIAAAAVKLVASRRRMADRTESDSHISSRRCCRCGIFLVKPVDPKIRHPTRKSDTHHAPGRSVFPPRIPSRQDRRLWSRTSNAHGLAETASRIYGCLTFAYALAAKAKLVQVISVRSFTLHPDMVSRKALAAGFGRESAACLHRRLGPFRSK